MEVDVETIVIVGFGISNTMDAIGMDKIVTATNITAIIGIMTGVMMTTVETVGMTT